MTQAIQPRYEFRIFGQDLSKHESYIKANYTEEMTRQMTSIYLLTAANTNNNIKIRDGIMDIKVLEKEVQGLEQWHPYLVGDFPMDADLIKTVVFPAFGINAPVFDRKEYGLDQFIDELVTIDPDLTVAYVNKTRHGFTINGCIGEIAEITVNGAFIKTICVESEDPDLVMKTIQKIRMNDKTENVSYPLALRRIMGLAPLPDNWKERTF